MLIIFILNCFNLKSIEMKEKERLNTLSLVTKSVTDCTWIEDLSDVVKYRVKMNETNFASPTSINQCVKVYEISFSRLCDNNVESNCENFNKNIKNNSKTLNRKSLKTARS